jgi:NAD(P)H-hydrate repair Nnr-like enzyme with NAD(P)H-hydrate dehydratase domain
MDRRSDLYDLASASAKARAQVYVLQPNSTMVIDASRKLAARFGATVLLKGNVTVIAEPSGEVYLNPAGQSWAATAGSGDVLSGITGALLAAGIPSGEAAAMAALVHARAAKLAATAPGPSAAPTSASGILAHIRSAIASL